jgi:uncharacterized protein (DUF2141 family)
MLQRTLALAVIALLASVTPFAEQRDRVEQPRPAGTGRIGGVVVASESGRPVRMADVMLFSTAGEFRAVTDDSGAFSFDKLPPGSYTLRTGKPGFLDAVYGQARPGTDTAGRTIALKDREVLRLNVPLSQGGSISGVVRDHHGDPVFGSQVVVSRWVMRGGKRRLEQVGSTETDERGMYRVGLLPSRQYVIGAVPREMTKGDDDEKPTQGYAPMFHPSATSPGGAETIALGVDEHRTNADVVLPLVKLSTIKGVVLDANSRPVPEMSVWLLDEQSIDHAERHTATEPNGRFEFGKVPPGSYLLMAGERGGGLHSVSFKFTTNDVAGDFTVAKRVMAEMIVSADKLHVERPSVRTGDEEPAANRVLGSASVDIAVTGDLIPDVTLRLDPPRTVVGRVLFEGAARRPASMADITVMLKPVTDLGSSQEMKVASDGTFTLKDVAPGRYYVDVEGAGDPWRLGSVMASGTDAMDFGLAVPRDRDVRDVTLTFRDRTADLSGVVTDASGQPVLNRRVILFPADERLWSYARDRINDAALTEPGKFEFRNLRPGSYWLALVTDLEQDEWMDPPVMRQLLGAAVSVIVGEGEKKVQDLRVR